MSEIDQKGVEGIFSGRPMQVDPHDRIFSARTALEGILSPNMVEQSFVPFDDGPATVNRSRLTARKTDSHSTTRP